jgi:hypothetical protein
MYLGQAERKYQNIFKGAYNRNLVLYNQTQEIVN